MIRRPRYAPADAERIALADCCTTALVPSRYAPKVKALKVTLKCPCCNLPQPDNALWREQAIVRCPCGLNMIVEPDCVYIWKQRRPAIPAAVAMILAFGIVALSGAGFYRAMKALDREQTTTTTVIRIAPKDMARLATMSRSPGGAGERH